MRSSGEKDKNQIASIQSTSLSLETAPAPLTATQKSQRYLETDEQEPDLKVSKSMQDFVYKKMSKTIENSVEFVDVPIKKPKKREEKCVVRLLKDTDPITNYKFDVIQSVKINQKKPVIKARVIEDSNLADTEKIQMTCVTANDILSGNEVRSWKEKKPKSHKIFKYKEKNNVLYLIESENEFTKLRKKNNWSENKIAGFKRKQTIK